ncbi:MAG: hypothetical protein WDO06_02000 [Actinomycetota bacterium]
MEDAKDNLIAAAHDAVIEKKDEITDKISDGIDRVKGKNRSRCGFCVRCAKEG